MLSFSSVGIPHAVFAHFLDEPCKMSNNSHFRTGGENYEKTFEHKTQIRFHLKKELLGFLLRLGELQRFQSIPESLVSFQNC